MLLVDEERIVFYSASFFKIDGVTLTLRGLIGFIVKERGCRVVVLTADEPTDTAIRGFTEENEGRAAVLRATGGLVPAPGSEYFMGLYLSKETKAQMEEYNPTVVHVTNPDLVALWLINWVLRERADCVLVATLHTNFIDIASSYFVAGRRQAVWATSAFLRHIYGLCPVVYAPTEFMRRKLEEYKWDTRIGVWGRGVDPELFSPKGRCQNLRRQLGLGPNDVAALWLGRVVQEKKPGVWLRAVQTIQREAQERYDVAAAAAAVTASADERKEEEEAILPPRVVGVCVGKGEAMGMLQGADGVVCVGWKTGQELAKVVASCDVMVAPSEIETFGRVTLEAMSCGLACVVNQECGEHLVKQGENGFCVPSRDVDGYLVGLRKLVEDRELRRKMSEAGRQMALGYGTTEVYDKMLEIYRSSRGKEMAQLREEKAKKRGWPFWEVFGLVVYYLFEMAKMVTAAITLVTQGSDSEVVRLSIKAFRKHPTLLAGLLGLNSLRNASVSAPLPAGDVGTAADDGLSARSRVTTSTTTTVSKDLSKEISPTVACPTTTTTTTTTVKMETPGGGGARAGLGGVKLEQCAGVVAALVLAASAVGGAVAVKLICDDDDGDK